MLRSVTSLSAVMADPTGLKYFFDSTNGWLYLKMVDNGETAGCTRLACTA